MNAADTVFALFALCALAYGLFRTIRRSDQ